MDRTAKAHHQIYNLSTAQPGTNLAVAPEETYTANGSKKDGLEIYSDSNSHCLPGWESRWHRSVMRVVLRIPTWHRELPRAIEDSAVIAECLAASPNPEAETIKRVPRFCESVRKERAEALVEMAAQSKRTLHLADGKAKKERDRLFE